MNIQQLAEQYAKRFTCIPLDETEKGVNEDIVKAISEHFIVGARWAAEEAARLAFEKVRCDDRTDRLQIAREVAAHIRALKE